jgi:O-methyltransferase involved in polyketide biosynthesis
LRGIYTLQPLNALDEAGFTQVVTALPQRPVTIVNEGLLMYLSDEEKGQLCGIIHRLLSARGGSWITADIYQKLPENVRNAIPKSPGETAFLEQHRIEENKFDSFEAAAYFFQEHGFQMIREAQVDYPTLTSVTHLLKLLPPEVREQKQGLPKIQATWMLKAI